MAATYDITTDRGKVRLKISDIDLTTVVGDRAGWTVLFNDDEIDAFIAEASSDLNIAAYLALLSVATSRALLAKIKKLGDYEEDLTKLAQQIRLAAEAYKTASTESVEFDIAEQTNTVFNLRDIVLRDML